MASYLDYSGLSYYHNKIKALIDTKQDIITDLSTIRSNAAAGAAKVSNVQADWNATEGLAVILNKPTIPSGGGDNKTPLNTIAVSSVMSINPYRFYNITGTVSNMHIINLNYGLEVSGYCAEYGFMFTAGSQCQLDIQGGNTYPLLYAGGGAPQYTAGRTYEVSINNGLIAIGEFYTGGGSGGDESESESGGDESESESGGEEE